MVLQQHSEVDREGGEVEDTLLSVQGQCVHMLHIVLQAHSKSQST
jgi:hypothetical protein